MKTTTAQRFGSLGKSFQSPSAAAAVLGAALLASGTTDDAETAWSPSAACLLPDVLPVAGTLLSYGGSRQLAAGGTVTHDGALTLSGATTITTSVASIPLTVGVTSQTQLRLGYYSPVDPFIYAQSGGYMYLGSRARYTLSLGADAGGGANPIVAVANDVKLGFSSTSYSDGTLDAYFVRNSASSIGVKGASGIDGALTCGAITASSNIVSTNTLGGGTYTTSINVNNPSLATAPGIQAYFSGDERGRIRFATGTGADLWIQPGTSGAVKLVTIPGVDAAMTCGAITASGTVQVGGPYSSTSLLTAVSGILYVSTAVGNNSYGVIGSGNGFNSTPLQSGGGLHLIGTNGDGYKWGIGWSNDTTWYGSKDVILWRKATGQMGVAAANGLAIRNLADSADATLSCGAITASGNLNIGANSLVGAYSGIYNEGKWLTGSDGYGSFYISPNNAAFVFAPPAAGGTVIGSVDYQGRFNALLGFGVGSQDPANTTVRYFRNETGPKASIRAAGGAEIKTLDGSADAPLTCGAITASGAIKADNVYASNWLKLSGSNQTTQGAAIRNGMLALGSDVAIGWSTGSDPTSNQTLYSITPSSGLLTFGGGITASGQIIALNVRCQDGNGIVGTRYINNSNDTWSAFEFPASVLGAVFSPGVAGILRFEGSTPSHPAIKRSGTTTAFRLADDSADGPISCGAITASGDVTLSGSQTLWALNVRSTVNTWNIIGASGNIDTLGTLDIRTATNSTTAFRVRNAALSNVIVVDTTNRTFAAGGDAFAVRNSTGGTYLFNGGFLAVTNSTDASSAAADTFLSRASAGVWRFGTTSTGTDAGIQCGAITASGAIQETPTQSALDPTTTNIPSGKRQGWYNSTLAEFRDWVNIGGTLLKSAAYT